MEGSCEVRLLLLSILIVVHSLAVMFGARGHRRRIPLCGHHDSLVIAIKVDMPPMSGARDYRDSLRALLAPASIHNQPGLRIRSKLVEILDTVRLSRKTNTTVSFAVRLLTVASGRYTLSLCIIPCCPIDIGGFLTLSVVDTSSDGLGVD